MLTSQNQISVLSDRRFLKANPHTLAELTPEIQDVSAHLLLGFATKSPAFI
jgi:hypothetical protein